MEVPYSSLCISLVRGGVPVRQIVFFLRAVTIPEHYKSGLARRREVQDLPSIKATTTLRSGTALHELIPDSARYLGGLPTLLVNPISFPYSRAATATPAAQSVTLSTGPRTVGKIEPLKTRISGSQEILDSYTCQFVDWHQSI
jgi:hypothetical protein